jgi:hypothetical protein
MTNVRVSITSLLVVGMLAAMIPLASAASTSLTCTNANGTVALKVTANSHAAKGLDKALAVTDMAQKRLDVTCTRGDAEERVLHKVGVRCTRANGDVVMNVKADKHAFKGLDTSVKAFMRHAGARLNLTCEIVDA